VIFEIWPQAGIRRGEYLDLAAECCRPILETIDAFSRIGGSRALREKGKKKDQKRRCSFVRDEDERSRLERG